MRRFNWKKVTIGLGATLLILVGIGYWGMSFTVNKVLETLADDSIMESMVPSPSADQSPIPVLVEPSPAAGVNSTDEAGSPAPQETPSVKVEAEAPQATASTGHSEDDYNGAVDTGKAKNAQEHITISDKMRVTAVFMKRFSAKELEAFSKLASGGLTLEEKQEAKKIVLQRLTEEEYDDLIQIAARLGLSQGKSHNESMKE